MIEDANESAEAVNDHLNDNASKEEFKRLWEEINHRYVYTVHYDSEELIQKAVASINKNLRVTELKYVVTTGEQGTDDLDFTGDQHTRTQAMKEVSTSDVPYDLVGEIAKGATLTRRTVVRILKGISTARLYLFKNNPEEFIRNVVRLIKDQKATMIVEHIAYNRTEQQYDADIFTKEKNRQPLEKAYEAKKHRTARASESLPKHSIRLMRYASMPVCHARSKYLRQWASMPQTGLLPSMTIWV